MQLRSSAPPIDWAHPISDPIAHLPMRDKLVLGHPLGKHPCAEQLDSGDQLTTLDPPRCQILLDNEHRDLTPLNEIDHVVVHPWCLGLLPAADSKPGRALARDRIIHSVSTQHDSVLSPR